MFGKLYEKIRTFANRVIQVITDVTNDQGKVSSGRTIGSLVRNINFKANEAIELDVFGSKVFEYIERGRKVGDKMPPDLVLREWMRNKGIPFEKEFAVRRAISQKGIEPVPILEVSFIQVQREFDNSLTSEIASELSNVILEMSRRGFVLPVTNI